MGEIWPAVLGSCALLATGALLTLAAGRWGREENGGAGGRGRTSNTILLALGGFLVAFIVAMTVIFCVKGAVPDTLIQYTLGAGGVEALLLAGIKISKVVTGDKPGEDE